MTPAISPGRSTPRLWLVLWPLLFYAAALNPYFLPATYDNIVYHFGAISLAEEGSFKFCGRHITDWPPGLSVLVAVPFSLGWQSVTAAKACVLLCVAGGLLLGLRLFQTEHRPHPFLTFSLFALLPISFLMGTRTMSEWPFFLASVLFLNALQKIRPAGSSLLLAAGTGLLLGAASLTKFTGVVLGAAVVAQAAGKWTRSGKRLGPLLPELIAAAVGGACFVAWKLKIDWQIAAGTATPYDYYRSGWLPDHLRGFSPFTVPGKITDLLFHSEAVMGRLGWEGWTAALVCAVPGVVVLAGLVIRLRSAQRTPSDYYVLGLLVLFSLIGTNQQTRYLMPAGPFLISYGFVACRALAGPLARRMPRLVWPSRLALAAWLVVLSGAALQLLAAGNLNGTHRGLCFWASPRAESFYRGYWLDLYRACRIVKNDPTPGKVAVLGGDDKYVTAFTRRPLTRFNSTSEFVFLLVLDGTVVGREQQAGFNLECVGGYGSLVLYKRSHLPHSRQLTAYENY